MQYSKLFKTLLNILTSLFVTVALPLNAAENTPSNKNPKPSATDEKVHEAIHKAAEIKKEVEDSTKPIVDQVVEHARDFNKEYLVPAGNAIGEATHKVGEYTTKAVAPINDAASTAMQKAGEYKDYVKEEFGWKSKSEVKPETNLGDGNNADARSSHDTVPSSNSKNSPYGSNNKPPAPNRSDSQDSQFHIIGGDKSGSDNQKPEDRQGPRESQFHVIGEDPASHRDQNKNQGSGDAGRHDDGPRGGGGGRHDDGPRGGGGGGGRPDDGPHGGGGGSPGGRD